MPETISQGELAAAQKRLSAYITSTAEETERRLGFGWEPVEPVPSRYSDFCHAFAVSYRDGRPLPVFGENSVNALFGDPAVNLANRFIHDGGHVERELSFSSPNGFELAGWQMRRFEKADLNKTDLEWQLFEADAVGQVMYYSSTKQYVGDQLQFTPDCVRHGAEKGLYLEMERQP